MNARYSDVILDPIPIIAATDCNGVGAFDDALQMLFLLAYITLYVCNDMQIIAYSNVMFSLFLPICAMFKVRYNSSCYNFSRYNFSQLSIQPSFKLTKIVLQIVQIIQINMNWLICVNLYNLHNLKYNLSQLK